ncbi:MAG: MFS transporter [Pseudomonadota bacterium]|nr:MFS transporter [Pseudomonadota bacterium]
MSALRTSAVFLIATVCSAQAFTQIGSFTFSALLPTFFTEWGITHTEAGWLSGIIFLAYAMSVPFILPLTDRVDPRRVYICFVTLTCLSHLGMAFIANDFWGGLLFRMLAGIGWGGTYMVGLKALADLIEGPKQSRAVAFHAGSIGAGGALSFLIAGYAAEHLDWQTAFIISALGSFTALIIMITCVPSRKPPPQNEKSHPFEFLPVLKNKSAMAYAIGYCVHTWEMFTLRSWVVAFLVFTAAQGDQPNFFIPTVIAMLMELIGTMMSIVGNEIAIHIGRRRWIFMVMIVSMMFAVLIGFSAGLGYGVAAMVCLTYNAIIYADSSSLTAGTLGNAETGRRGATHAVQAMLGYGGGFVGPLVLGVILDILGGETVMNWGIAFSHVALIMLIGPIVLRILKPNDLPGDRPSG